MEKFALFRVCGPWVTRHVNNQIDETVLVPKSANNVVSYIHPFVCSLEYSEKNVCLHSSTCKIRYKTFTREMVNIFLQFTINLQPFEIEPFLRQLTKI